MICRVLACKTHPYNNNARMRLALDAVAVAAVAAVAAIAVCPGGRLSTHAASDNRAGDARRRAAHSGVYAEYME